MSSDKSAPGHHDSAPAPKKDVDEGYGKVHPIYYFAGILAVVILGLFVFFDPSPTISYSPKESSSEVKESKYLELHTLTKADTAILLRIEYGYHLHTFGIDSKKQYGFQSAGGERQIIGNGITASPEPIYARFAYISFEKEETTVDCMFIKNGTCPYDNY